MIRVSGSWSGSQGAVRAAVAERADPALSTPGHESTAGVAAAGAVPLAVIVTRLHPRASGARTAKILYSKAVYAPSNGRGETRTLASLQPWSFAWISLDPNLGVT